MGILTTLEPKETFKYFEEICHIPHGSGNLEQISNYCVEFAKKHNLAYRQDEYLNVIIWKPATKGYENSPTVILQGHMDMVAVKEADCSLDLDKEGLIPEIEGDFISAKGTSLGGDDGIAVAYALAILASDDLEHPALEAVFTVDEEIGMLGAAAIDLSDLKGRILLNMDSEDEGIFLTSCAGGATVCCNLPLAEGKEEAGEVYQLDITGLTGGHSGAEIHKGRANANVLMGRVLFTLEEEPEIDFALGNLYGGEKDNAIAKFAHAKLVVAKPSKELFEKTINKIETTIKEEFKVPDPNLSIMVKKLDEKKLIVMSPSDKNRVILELIHLPAGIQKMSTEMENMVETSLNMGIMSIEENTLKLCYSVRSSISSEKAYLVEKMISLTELLGGECEISGNYPGWAYRADSPLREKMCETYEKLFGHPAKVEGIHAGVECGLLLAKIPNLDCVSFGPQMHDIHTVHERLSISSVRRTWDLVVEVLRNLK